MNPRRAFTLIELLVVITIIGIVAAMVVNMNTRAQNVKRNTMVNADKARLTLAIDNYQSRLNFYPPDNGGLATAGSGPYYDGLASTNPLLYELTGATNSLGQIQLFDNISSTSNFQAIFNRPAVANGSTDEPRLFFLPPTRQYTNFGANLLEGLLVPVSLTNDPTFNNYWHYDSSSTNRHNLSSYDLWAEYITGNQGGSNIITTNGNW